MLERGHFNFGLTYHLHVRVKQFGNALLFRPNESIVELANWAKETTDVRAIFLVHPSWRQFRGLSHRGLFVTVKDGEAILWRRNFVEEWSKRLSALGYDMTKAQIGGSMTRDLSRLYEALNDQQVQKISPMLFAAF